MVIVISFVLPFCPLCTPFGSYNSKTVSKNINRAQIWWVMSKNCSNSNHKKIGHIESSVLLCPSASGYL